MNRSILIGACLLPWLAGCALFDPNAAVPPAPKVVGVSAQDRALQENVRTGHGDEPDVFVPLVQAKAAVESARTQPKISDYASGLLAQARAELNKAEQLWSTDQDSAEYTPEQLRAVEQHAHSAKRLAQIAQYTAEREINLAQLDSVSAQLRKRRYVQNRSKTTQAAATGDQSQQLIGQRVVPGALGDLAFEPGTARLSNNSQAVVSKLAALLKRNTKVGVAILGHTSTNAPPDDVLQKFVQANPHLQKRDLTKEQKVYAYNIALSNARAEAVARALVKAGIKARRIGARGFGSSRPVASNDTA